MPNENVRLIRTMTTKVAFKAMYKAIGFSDDAAADLTNTEVVDSMPKLSRITYACASKICKAIRSPAGAGAVVHVTEGAEHNLVIAASVALNASRICVRLNVRISGRTLQTCLTSMRVSYYWRDSRPTRNGRKHSGPCRKVT